MSYELQRLLNVVVSIKDDIAADLEPGGEHL